MKTLEQWINESTLSKKDKVLFFSNMKEYYGKEYKETLNYPSRGFAHALSMGFRWHESEQGFNYWNNYACDPELNKNNE